MKYEYYPVTKSIFMNSNYRIKVKEDSQGNKKYVPEYCVPLATAGSRWVDARCNDPYSNMSSLNWHNYPDLKTQEEAEKEIESCKIRHNVGSTKETYLYL